jgi:hypothetical protein
VIAIKRATETFFKSLNLEDPVSEEDFINVWLDAMIRHPSGRSKSQYGQKGKSLRSSSRLD